MFCTECGQPMADEAKFCAYCGTRRVVPPSVGQNAAPVPEVKPEPQPPAPAAPPARAIRSTAEIMPMRLRANPRAGEDASSTEQHHVETTDRAVPLREEEATPLFKEPEPPPLVKRYTPPPPPPQTLERTAPEVSAPPSPRYGSVPFAAEPGALDTVGERRRFSPVLIAAIIVALIAIAGIVWMVRSSVSLGGKSAQPVAITIYPTSAKVAPGKGVDFVAEVTGAPGSEVTWNVEEGANLGSIQSRGASAKEDTISLYCTYTTPTKPGTYHLVATSTADKSKSATAEIIVAGK